MSQRIAAVALLALLGLALIAPATSAWHIPPRPSPEDVTDEYDRANDRARSDVERYCKMEPYCDELMSPCPFRLCS